MDVVGSRGRPGGGLQLDGGGERGRVVVDVEQLVCKHVTEPLGLVTDQRRVIDAGLDAQEHRVGRTQRPLHKVLHRLHAET